MVTEDSLPLGLVVLGLVAIAVLILITGMKPVEIYSVTLVYQVKIGNPAGGVFGGYTEECYYTNDKPQLDEATKSVVITNYYYGSCRAYKDGPFGTLTKIVPNSYIEMSDKGFTIFVREE